MSVSNDSLAEKILKDLKNLPPEALDKVDDFNNGAKGIPLTNIQPTAYVRSKSTKAIFPYSSTLAQRGDLFEPYYGPIKEPEMSDIEIAFERMKRNATTKQERAEIEQKRQAFLRGAISRDDIIRAGERSVKQVDFNVAEYSPKVQPTPEAYHTEIKSVPEDGSFLDSAAIIPDVDPLTGIEQAPLPPQPMPTPVVAKPLLTVEDIMRGIMNVPV